MLGEEEGGREGGRKGGRKGGREVGEGVREGGREGREGEREEDRLNNYNKTVNVLTLYIKSSSSSITPTIISNFTCISSNTVSW